MWTVANPLQTPEPVPAEVRKEALLVSKVSGQGCLVKNWQTYLLASTALVSMGGVAANAAPPAPVTFGMWSGGYIGGNIAVARMSSNCTTVGYGYYSCGAEYGNQTYNQTGVMGGLQAGWDWQDRYFVYGVVGDVDWAGLKATSSQDAGYYAGDAKVNWVGTFRGRAGVALENTLIYFTGGVAVGGVSGSANADHGVYPYQGFNKTNVGWVAGMGIEHKFAGTNMSVFAQALYYDLGSVTGPVTVYSETYQSKYTYDVYAAEFGFNWHF
jgi:outer membrane immunogenic protein